MGLLDIEKDRLKKHYEELVENYTHQKELANNAIVDLSKTEMDIISKFPMFVDTYTKINCTPEFFEVDNFGEEKVNLDIKDLKLDSKNILEVSKAVKTSNINEYAIISLIGTKKLLEKSCELGIVNEKNINHDNMPKLVEYLSSLHSKVIDQIEVIDIDDSSIIEYEKKMHKAISGVKEAIESLKTIESLSLKYKEKLLYLGKIYEHDRERVREYIDFTGIKDWKELDKEQDALMAIHSNITVAQLLHDMCNASIIEGDGALNYKSFQSMIEKADNVIDVIDVYLKTNVF